MATKTYAGVNVEVNDEGYMTDAHNGPKKLQQKLQKKKVLNSPTNILKYWNSSETNQLKVQH